MWYFIALNFDLLDPLVITGWFAHSTVLIVNTTHLHVFLFHGLIVGGVLGKMAVRST